MTKISTPHLCAGARIRYHEVVSLATTTGRFRMPWSAGVAAPPLFAVDFATVGAVVALAIVGLIAGGVVLSYFSGVGRS